MIKKWGKVIIIKDEIHITEFEVIGKIGYWLQKTVINHGILKLIKERIKLIGKN